VGQDPEAGTQSHD